MGLELGAIGVGESADVPGELDDGNLKAKTDAEEREIVFAGPPDGLHHTPDATLPEATRNQETIVAAEQPSHGGLIGELIAGDPFDLDLCVVRNASMDQRFLD